MSFKLKETEENKNYLIAKLEKDNEEYYFIHDKESGENYFNQAVLKELFGVTQRNMSHHLNKYLEFNENDRNKSLIVLKLVHSKSRVKFYSFDAVTYLAYRINTEEALSIRDWISQTLNEKYNQEKGLSKPKLKNPLKQRIKKAVYSKNFKIGKAYSLYHELNNIGYDKSAKMVYHQLKLDEADRDVLREAFTLVDKAEDILKKEEDPKQTKLVEGE